jgi:hypothetical protein
VIINFYRICLTKMRVKIVPAINILILVLLPGCQRAEEDNLPAHSTGLRSIIENADDFDDIFVEDIRIDLKVPDTLLLGDVLSMYITRDRTIGLLEWTYRVPLLFDSTGTFMQSIGEVGRGPGEFQFAAALCYDENRNVWLIADAALRSVSVFTHDGNFLYSFSVGSAVSHMRVTGDENLVLYLPDEIENGMIRIVDGDGNRIVSFFDQPELRRQLPFFSLMGGGGFTMLDDGIAAGHVMSPQIEYYSFDGVLIDAFDLTKLDHFIAPDPERFTGNVPEFLGSFTGVFNIFRMPDDLLFVLYGTSGFDGRERVTYIAILDTDGTVLNSGIAVPIHIRFADHRGRIYTLDYREEFDALSIIRRGIRGLE